MNFSEAFELLLTFEGTAFTNISGDAGGRTKYGISEKVYPELDIENLTEEHAKAIYGTDYWNRCKINYLPEQLQYIVFDSAVNLGQGTAIMLLQKAANIKVDGIIGQQTIDASQHVTIQEYAALRLAHYEAIIQKNPQDEKFRLGWTNRVNDILKLYNEGKL